MKKPKFFPSKTATMYCILYLFSLFVVPSKAITLHSNSNSSFPPSCLHHEQLALLRFKNSFHIECSASANSYPGIVPYAKVKSWIGKQHADCCSWDGVECDRRTGHVIGLDLKASCLYGTFPLNNTIFKLPYLRKLVLSYNNFNYSQIPSEVGRLSKLRILKLLDSTFSGQIPAEISTLSELSILELGGNSTATQLLKLRNPSLENLLQNLTHLQELSLQNVDVSSKVPIILQNMTTLKRINLYGCNLQGELPPYLLRLPHLETLNLRLNDDVSGSLREFQWHSPLKHLNLFGTLLSGELPPSIGRLANLEALILSNCLLSGAIPSSLGNLTKLSQLYLDDNNFSGAIPASISNLTNLEQLYLSDLRVMPEQLNSNFGKLNKLTALSLSGMKLGSRIPPFLANLTKLTDLFLINTQIVGILPQWFANLTQLELLHLDGNRLEGPIPQWLPQLVNLQVLDLSYNNLHGNFVSFYGLENLVGLFLSGISLKLPTTRTSRTNSSLFKLQFVEMKSCDLTEFPAFLRDQRELQHLGLGQNNIEGSIPQWFVNTSKDSLRRFELSDNNLTGFEHPVTVLPWTRLEVFDISGNNFQGKLPTPPLSIQSYDVSNNLFTGLIPTQMCMARSLIKLDLSKNNLSSQLIPRCVTNRLGESLQLLNLRGNNFHGGIPRSFSTYCTLKMINLSENQLEGDMPRSLANCTMLEVLDIGKNRINDTFPYWLGSLPNLQVLVLNRNNFHGSISDHDLGPQFSSLRIIDLSHNFYIGDLPSSYFRYWSNMMTTKEDQSNSYSTMIIFPLELHGDVYATIESSEYSMTITSKGRETLYSKILEVFRVVDFSSNNFTGKIPDDIGNLKGLQALNLSNNNLDGWIPVSVANMEDIESLDLSRNMLYGEIPRELSQLTYLEVFDVSYNHLEGPVPHGNQFNTFLDSSYTGNSRLCGSPLSKNCQNADAPISSQMANNLSNDEDSRWIDWIVRSSGCVSGFIIGVVIGKLFITDKYHEWFMETFQRRPRKKVKRAARRQPTQSNWS